MKSMLFEASRVPSLRAMLALASIGALLGIANDVRAEIPGALRMHVVEDQRVIPRDPRHPPPAVEPDDLEQALQQRLQARFVSITGSLDRPMSATQARLDDWGFVSENAAAIDKNGDGSISFGELDVFMRKRAPARAKQGQ